MLNFAQLLSVSREAAFLAGVGLTSFGLYLRVRLADHVMRAEELMKEGRLTDAQARSRITVARLAGPAAILLGWAAFALVFWL